MSKISIIVPVYNVEKFLNRCLDSIIAQTFTDWVCILIDDGSPDNSGKICDEYAKKDDRFVVIHQKNAGSSVARNTGLNVAQGDFIAFVDSDDWVEPEYLDELFNKATENDADIVGCDLYREKINESTIQTVKLDGMSDYCSSILTGELPAWLWIKFFKKQLIFNNKINFLSTLDMCEDTLFSLKAFFYASKVCYIDKPLYHYNLSNQSSLTSVLSEKKVEQILQNNEEYVNFLRMNNSYAKYKCDILRRKAFTKIWILLECEKIKYSYLRLYEEDLLYKVREQSFFSKIFLYLLNCHLDFLAKKLIKIRRNELEKNRNYLNEYLK